MASVEREMTEASLIEREITKEPGTEQEQETTHVSTEEEQPSMGLEGQKCVRGLATASVSGEISGKGLTDASLMRSITSDDADEIGILQAAVAPPNESVREDAAEADGGALEAALEDHEDRDETMPGGFDTGDVPTPPGRAVTSYAGLGIHNSPEKLARDEQEGLATPAAKGLPPLPEASEDEARLKAKLPLSSSARELSFSRPETALTDSQTQDEENAEELRVMCAERLMTAMSTGELETAIDGIERHRGATPPPDGRIDILRTDLSDVPEGPESPASASYAPRGAGAV